MNRRDALRALMTLPTATRITHADVKTDDVIVLECPELLTDAARVFLKIQMKQVWPGNRVVVLDGGMRLKIAGARHDE